MDFWRRHNVITGVVGALSWACSFVLPIALNVANADPVVQEAAKGRVVVLAHLSALPAPFLRRHVAAARQAAAYSGPVFANHPCTSRRIALYPSKRS